jgi:hypothetical protein
MSIPNPNYAQPAQRPRVTQTQRTAMRILVRNIITNWDASQPIISLHDLVHTVRQQTLPAGITPDMFDGDDIARIAQALGYPTQ